MNATSRLLLALAFAIGSAAPSAAYDFGLIVPVFSGPRQLARNVSTTLYLQVWRTLRRKPWPNPRKLDFGSGIARYDWGGSFEPSTPDQVAAYARSADVQMVLWGSAAPLGDGVVVQAFLAAPDGVFGTGKPEYWTLNYKGRSVSLDLPRRSFDFEPVVLDSKLVAYYSGQERLVMCDRPILPCKESAVGDDWTALEQSGQWAKVIATRSQRIGWIHLPGLDVLRNDASDFTIALMAYYRGDYEMAASFFDRVANHMPGQSSTRVDAAVLALIARARDGRIDLAGFNRLSDTDPTSIYIFKAQMMARLKTAFNASDGSAPRQLDAIFTLIDRNRNLIDEDDRWLRDMDAIARASHSEKDRL